VRPSAERVAVDLVAAGEYEEAARAYEEMAIAAPAGPGAAAFREAARILRARVRAGGGRADAR
jgi:hypothetical protein